MTRRDSVNGHVMRAEFLRLAEATAQATGQSPDPELSVRQAGVWTMRGCSGVLLAEVSVDGTVIEASPGFDLGLMDRVADLRALGFSSRAILAWFGEQAPSDAARDAQEVLMITMRIRC